MRVFLDTNIVLEYLCKRKQYALAKSIFTDANYYDNQYFISIGSFYTITYLLESYLHKQGMRFPNLAEALRLRLESLIQLFHVSGPNERQLLEGVRDRHFLDLEDSYQYQTALSNGCAALVTLDQKDYLQRKGGDIEILSLEEYVAHYLNE